MSSKSLLGLSVFRDWFVVLGCSAALTLVAPDGAGRQLLQGTIDGNVMDSSQAAVPDAIVTAKDQQTNYGQRRRVAELHPERYGSNAQYDSPGGRDPDGRTGYRKRDGRGYGRRPANRPRRDPL